MYTKEIDYRLVGIAGTEDPTISIIKEEDNKCVIYHDKYFVLIDKIFQRNVNNITIPHNGIVPSMAELLGLPNYIISPSDIDGFNINLINYKNVY